MAVSHGEYIVKRRRCTAWSPANAPRINTGSVSGGKLQGQRRHCGLMDTAEYDNRVAAAMGGGAETKAAAFWRFAAVQLRVCVSLSRWPCERLDQAGVGDVLNRNRESLLRFSTPREARPDRHPATLEATLSVGYPIFPGFKPGKTYTVRLLLCARNLVVQGKLQIPKLPPASRLRPNDGNEVLVESTPPL